MKPIVFFLLQCLLSSLLFITSPTYAQTGFFQDDTLNFENELLSGFSEDGRIKVLLLTLAPSGMTETAAEQIGKAIELNLFNTNHFTVVGPSEWNAQLQARDPNLADCHDIACGILIGKIFNADKVLVGQIRAGTILDAAATESDGFILSLRQLDVLTNTTDYVDQIQFIDENMHDELFKMAVRISENTLLRGRVLSVGERTVTVDWGRAHGLQEGDRFVIYNEPETSVNLEGQTLGIQQNNIAVAQIHKLNDMTSEAIVTQVIESPTIGSYAKTFVNSTKQVELLSDVRRELDTRKRIRPRKRLVLEAQTIVEDTGREKWERRLEMARDDQQRWLYITIGSSVTTLLILQTNFEIGFLGQLNQLIPILAGAGSFYSGYQYYQKRRVVQEIMAEGRIKKFTSSSSWNWHISPFQRQIFVSYRF